MQGTYGLVMPRDSSLRVHLPNSSMAALAASILPLEMPVAAGAGAEGLEAGAGDLTLFELMDRPWAGASPVGALTLPPAPTVAQ